MVYRAGTSSFNASFSHQILNMLSEEGFDRLIALPSREELRLTNRTSRNTEPFTNAALGWAKEDAPDRSIHLNAKLSRIIGTLRQEGRSLWRRHSGRLYPRITLRPATQRDTRGPSRSAHQVKPCHPPPPRQTRRFDRPCRGPPGGFTRIRRFRDERWSVGVEPNNCGWSASRRGGAFNRSRRSRVSCLRREHTSSRCRSMLPWSPYRGEGFVNGAAPSAATFGSTWE